MREYRRRNHVQLAEKDGDFRRRLRTIQAQLADKKREYNAHRAEKKQESGYQRRQRAWPSSMILQTR